MPNLTFFLVSGYANPAKAPEFDLIGKIADSINTVRETPVVIISEASLLNSKDSENSELTDEALFFLQSLLSNKELKLYLLAKPNTNRNYQSLFPRGTITNPLSIIYKNEGQTTLQAMQSQLSEERPRNCIYVPAATDHENLESFRKIGLSIINPIEFPVCNDEDDSEVVLPYRKNHYDPINEELTSFLNQRKSQRDIAGLRLASAGCTILGIAIGLAIPGTMTIPVTAPVLIPILASMLAVAAALLIAAAICMGVAWYKEKQFRTEPELTQAQLSISG